MSTAAADFLEPRPKVTLADFEIKKLLGRGAFGKVMLAVHRETAAEYAIKMLNKRMLVAVKQTKGALTERAILTQKGHPCIVRLYWAFQDQAPLT